MADPSEDLPEITITIKAPSDSKQTVTISPSKTVLELKQKVAEASGVEVDRQRLIYSGKVLKDEDLLSVYKIQNNHSIHLVKGAAKPSSSSSSPAASASSAAASTGSGTGTSANRGIPSTFAAGLPVVNDPLAQLEGMRGHGLGGGTFNPFAGMPGAENLMGDPNAMANMMNNPEMISAAMAQLTPEMVDTVIASNPQLQAMGPQVRQMMTSPMFRQMMADPQMVRQMLDMQRGMGGMGGFGGAGGGSPFPAPGGGAPSTTPSTTTGTAATGATAAPPNPYAAVLGGGNPFAGIGAGAAGGAGAGVGAANPFGMTPEMMQQMQQMMGGGAGAGGFGGFGGLGGYGGAPAAPAMPADTRSIEERFQSQLLQLNEMGLCDPQQNIRALTMTGGNVQAAIELIFSGSVPAGQQ